MGGKRAISDRPRRRLAGSRAVLAARARKEYPGLERRYQDRAGGPGFGAVALMDKAPHPNAAIVYLNWLLSKEGQTEYAKSGRNSRRLDVPPSDPTRGPSRRPLRGYPIRGFDPATRQSVGDLEREHQTVAPVARRGRPCRRSDSGTTVLPIRLLTGTRNTPYAGYSLGTASHTPEETFAMHIIDSHFHWWPRSVFERFCKRKDFPRAPDQ